MIQKIYSSLSVAIAACLLGLMILSFSSCGGKSPKKVAEKAVTAELNGDLDEFYDLLSLEDKDAVSLENFIRFYKVPVDMQDALELSPKVREAIKVEKFTSSVNGETATVTYFVQLPDLESMGNLSLEDAKRILSMKSSRLKDLPEDILAKIKASIEEKGVPTRSHAKEMKMRREGNEWKVYMNLAGHVQGGGIGTIYDHD